MKCRQTSLPRQWLITDERVDLAAALTLLPRGSGILVRNHELPAGARARLLRRINRIARLRGWDVVDEADGQIVRVHGSREIVRARLRGARALMLSPIHATQSHPEWKPLPRMRAVALARLAGLPMIALGGMTAERFSEVQPLGFSAWAGIDAWKASAART